MENDITFRSATSQELPAIVLMLADDDLGSKREDASIPLSRSYIEAFEAIAADPNNELVVAVKDDQVVGVLQMTFILYLTYQGGWRALIEGVRVSRSARSSGIGRSMFDWAIRRARERKCLLVHYLFNSKYNVFSFESIVKINDSKKSFPTFETRLNFNEE